MKLPVLSSRQLCTFLRKEGFVFVRQKGSHAFYEHNDTRAVVVPMHTNKPIGKGMLRAILEEINMSRQEFLRKWYKKK